MSSPPLCIRTNTNSVSASYSVVTFPPSFVISSSKSSGIFISFLLSQLIFKSINLLSAFKLNSNASVHLIICLIKIPMNLKSAIVFSAEISPETLLKNEHEIPYTEMYSASSRKSRERTSRKSMSLEGNLPQRKQERSAQMTDRHLPEAFTFT